MRSLTIDISKRRLRRSRNLHPFGSLQFPHHHWRAFAPAAAQYKDRETSRWLTPGALRNAINWRRLHRAWTHGQEWHGFKLYLRDEHTLVRRSASLEPAH